MCSNQIHGKEQGCWYPLMCMCRSGLIPPVLVSSAQGPLGGDRKPVTSAPALQENSTSWLSRMGGWDKLQVKWWERSIAVWVAEKGSARNVPGCRGLPENISSLLCEITSDSPSQICYFGKFNGHQQLWFVEPLISFNHANSILKPQNTSMCLLFALVVRQMP